MRTASVGSEAAMRRVMTTRRMAAASAVGTTLEWYDFAVYNTLSAIVFNQVFFPSFNPLTGVILAFSTFAVGYVSRPFGGVFFGRLGDKLGRRYVLFVTLIVMGLSTFFMGLLPTYASIGIISPILLVALRFLQGVALGGEWAGAVLVSAEQGAQNKRGLNGSFTQLGPALGTLLGTATIALITTVFSPEAFVAFGWRIPLLASIGLVFFGVWIRRGIEETSMFMKLEQSGAKAKAPIGEVVRLHWRGLLIGGGVRVGTDVLYTLVAVFSLTYATTVLGQSRTMGLTAIMIGTVFNALTIPLCGALSDRLGRRPVYAAGAILGILWAFGFFVLFESQSPIAMIAAVVVGYLIHSLMYGPQAALIIEQFPTRVRYAGSSLAYTLAGFVGAGFAPLIMAALFREYNTSLAISGYIVAAQGVTLLCLFAARETSRDAMEK